MEKKEIQVEVTQATIDTIEDAYLLQRWCHDQVESGEAQVYTRITNHLARGYAIQVGGETADEKDVPLGSTVTWDGSQFTVS